MMQDGWFPFVSLIGDGFDKIQLYYTDVVIGLNVYKYPDNV
jgi:hypothetical protein